VNSETNVPLVPPSDNVTLDTMMEFGAVDTTKTIRDASSPVDGDYCYMYE
jgi:tyrosinase